MSDLSEKERNKTNIQDLQVLLNQARLKKCTADFLNTGANVET
jgi:hypothetical protein